MKNLYEQAKKCFLCSDPDEKLQISLQISSDWEAGLLDHKEGETPIQFDLPGRLDKPPFVAVQKVKKRGFKSIQQRAALIHALTHIELTAVNLAWDSIYRYRGLPKEYYADWVKTGKEESQHFYLLKQSLNEMGYDYGDFPVHDELWQMAVTTADDLMDRMAIVHRVLEARALDVVPFAVDKFRQLGDQNTASSLIIIANDEIGHVNAGSRWFRYRCEQEKVNSDEMFFKLMNKYLKSTPKGPFNSEARMKAGFSRHEMLELNRLDLEFKQQKKARQEKL